MRLQAGPEVVAELVVGWNSAVDTAGFAVAEIGSVAESAVGQEARIVDFAAEVLAGCWAP